MQSKRIKTVSLIRDANVQVEKKPKKLNLSLKKLNFIFIYFLFICWCYCLFVSLFFHPIIIMVWFALTQMTCFPTFFLPNSGFWTNIDWHICHFRSLQLKWHAFPHFSCQIQGFESILTGIYVILNHRNWWNDMLYELWKHALWKHLNWMHVEFKNWPGHIGGYMRPKNTKGSVLIQTKSSILLLLAKSL